MELVDDGDPVRALGFIAVYSAYAEQKIDELIEYFSKIDSGQPPKLINSQATEKIKYLKKFGSSLEWPNNEGNEFAILMDAAKASMDERGEYLHNRYIAIQNGKILMKPGRPNRPEQEITSAELYEFANHLFILQSNLNRSRFWLSRVSK